MRVLLLNTSYACWLGLISIGTVQAQDAQANTEHLNVGKNKLAVKGYDLVAYFTENKAMEGREDIAHSWGGIEYRFASERNKKLFVTNPERYQPSYGGWCATAMASGSKYKVNPESFKVVDGRLFLFYKKKNYDAQDAWNEDEATQTQSADKNWAKITEKE